MSVDARLSFSDECGRRGREGDKTMKIRIDDPNFHI